MTAVEDYLASKGVKLLRGYGDNLRTHCIFCQEDPGKRGRLYINVGADEKTAGLYMCHLCGEKGNFRTLQRHFGDEPRHNNQTGGSYTEVLRAAAVFYAAQRDKVLDYLRGRGLTDETIEHHQLGFAPGGKALTSHLKQAGFGWDEMKGTGLVVDRNGALQDFLQQEVTIPYHLHGMVVAIRGKAMNGKYRTPPGTKSRMFNTDAIGTDTTELVVCEGEFDAIILGQLGFSAVGLPGAGSFQPTWADYFNEVRRVYAVFDPDKAGRAGAEKLADVLGSKVKAIDLPVPDGATPSQVDPSWLVVEQGWTKGDFAQLFKRAVTANTLLTSPQDAFDEWTQYQGLSASALQLGFEAFDLAIRPGLLPGQVMVPLAKTNVGKTLFILNVLHRATMANQRPIKILLLSLEQTRGEWFERARRIWFFYNHCDIASLGVDWKTAQRRRGDLEDWVNRQAMTYWADRIWIIDKNRMSEADLIQALEDFKEHTGQPPDLVAIDYLGYWANSFPGNTRYEQVSNAIMGLKAIAKEWRVPVITPHQVNRGAEFGTEFQIDQARDAGSIEETADFALALWNADDIKGSQGLRQGRLNMKIGKSRHGGKSRIFPLQIGYLSLAIVPAEEAVRARKAAAESAWAELGTIDWLEAIFHHHLGQEPAAAKVAANPAPPRPPRRPAQGAPKVLHLPLGD